MILQKHKSKIVADLQTSANTTIIGLFRICYALLGLWYCYQTYLGPAYLKSPSLFAIALPVWAFILVLILVGLSFWPIKFIYYLMGVFVFQWQGGEIPYDLIFTNISPTPSFLGQSVQESLWHILTFWLLFIHLDDQFSLRNLLIKKYPWKWLQPCFWESSLRLPIILFAANMGSVLSNAGVAKVLDIHWIKGEGFARTLDLGWLAAEHASIILDRVWLSTTINYIAIAFEVFFVFLVVWKKTRIFGIFLLASFFGQLIWPLRLDIIGQIGMLMVLLSIAMVVSENKALASNQISISKWNQRSFYALMSLFLFFLFGILSPIWNKIGETSHLVKTSLHVMDHFDRPTFNVLTNWTLFTKRHFTGIAIYRIAAIDKNGHRNYRDPLFSVDHRPLASAKFMSIRHRQALMYPITDLGHVLSFSDDTQAQNLVATHRELNALFQFESKQQPGKILELEFSWVNANDQSIINPHATWITLARWKPQDNSITLINKPERLKKQPRVPNLPNYTP